MNAPLLCRAWRRPLHRTGGDRTQSDLVRRFAIPRRLFDQGVKRYGFHGLSYQFIVGQLSQQFPQLAHGKVVAAHLGSSARSQVTVLVLPTDEEQIIADEAVAIHHREESTS